MKKFLKSTAVALFLCWISSIAVFAAQGKIDQVQEDIEGLEKQKEQAKEKAKSWEGEASSLEGDLKEFNNSLASAVAELNETEQKLASTRDSLAATRKDLAAAREKEKEQYASMKKRIQFMYERSDSFYMETLFGSNSIAGIVNRADYIEALSRYDREKLDEYVETRKYVELCKEELEAEKGLLDEAKAAVKQEEANISSLIGEKEAQIVSVSGDIQNKEAAIKEYEAMIAQENAEIAALEKAVAEERARLEAENARVYNGGMFAWPCPGYKRISDEYGNRMHPILGIEKFHNGLDMAASSGTPILAAYDGDVVAAAYSGSMGNYIMIDHGSGLYTIYMHCSALYVSKGQSVSKGQNIAAVGSTGRSTGPHLHFSVRLNGNYVSPWNYLN